MPKPSRRRCDARLPAREVASDRLKSADLAAALSDLEGRPWAEHGAKRGPLTKHGMATLLAPFGIRPQTIRVGAATAKGYPALSSTMPSSAIWSRLPLCNRNI